MITRRPRLLFLSQTLPFPPHGGVEVRTFNVLRLLSKSFSVTALCFYRRGGAVRGRIQEAVSALSAYGDVEAFAIDQEHRRARFLADHAASVLGGRVYTVRAYASRPFRARLETLLSSMRFDLVHMDSLDLSGYLPVLGQLPVACTHHNVESELLRRRALVSSSPIMRRYLRYQASLMEREEVAWAPRVTLNVAVSRADRDQLKALAPTARFVVIPNGVDVDFFRPAPVPTDGIVFLGGSSWFPNRDGIRYFCDSILPLIRGRGHSPVVRWIGKSSAAEQHEFRTRYAVEALGYVHDIRPYVHAGACFVVPLRVGGGTRLKILDGWAMGKAVVSTTVGCEGLDAVDDNNILIRDTPDSFAAAVCRVLDDQQLRQRLGSAARVTAESVYAWDRIGNELTAAYMGLLPKQDGPPA